VRQLGADGDVKGGFEMVEAAALAGDVKDAKGVRGDLIAYDACRIFASNVTNTNISIAHNKR